MSRDIEEMLRARKFPVRVEYGPERLERSANSGPCVMVFERDRESGDGVEPVQGAQRNARMKCIRLLGVVVTVYARSSAKGARPNEHEAFCDMFVDALIVALHEWFEGAKTGALPQFSAAQMLSAEEIATLSPDNTAWAGAVYRLRFDLPRGVREWTYVPEDTRPRGDLPGAQQPGALPEGAAAGVSNEAHVHLAASDDEPEIVEFPGETPP
jgi:hypothetical protein